MPSRQQVIIKISEILGDLIGTGPVDITEQTTAADVNGWDSVNHVNLIVALEMEYNIKFRTAELDEIHKVADLVDLISAKLG